MQPLILMFPSHVPAIAGTVLNGLPFLLILENLIIALCYCGVGSGIAYGIWVNRRASVNPVIVTIAGIFYSCALGHGMHGLGAIRVPNAIMWQTAFDFITALIAIRFLTFYESFDVLARIGQIANERDQLELKNTRLQEALSALECTQSQLIQSEKMSGLGQLVAGVAHEINNPVSFIHGNLIYVRDYTDELFKRLERYRSHYPGVDGVLQGKSEDKELEDFDLDFIRQDLEKILESMKIGTDRIRQIVLSLRNFSRMDEASYKAVNIHEGIDSTLLILRHRLQSTLESPAIQVSCNYAPLPEIECYVGSINQVFMNILANAIDAIEETHRRSRDRGAAVAGQIEISTQEIDDDHIEIKISDNGAGMDQKTRDRIFDPFYTTKPIGKGTGMGMSISYQIVTDKHGGQLICDSTPDGGSIFIIQIPKRQRCQGEEQLRG